MDEFASAVLSKGGDRLKDVDASISYTPFGIDFEKQKGSKGSIPDDSQPSDNVPDSVRKWRHEYIANIKKKDANEAEQIKLMKDNAEKELIEWQGWYKKNLIQARQENLAHEEELLAQRDKSALLSQSVSMVNPSDSAIWERVCQLCDLTVLSGDSLFSSKSSSQSKDVTRYRSLLLSLKNNPPSLAQ